MKDKSKDNSIDFIFKNAIEGAKTEPSDRFWNKANEEILARENGVYRNKINMWRGIAAALAGIVIVMAYYSFFIQSKVTIIENKLAEVEKIQASSQKQKNESANEVLNGSPVEKTTGDADANAPSYDKSLSASSSKQQLQQSMLMHKFLSLNAYSKAAKITSGDKSNIADAGGQKRELPPTANNENASTPEEKTRNNTLAASAQLNPSKIESAKNDSTGELNAQAVKQNLKSISVDSSEFSPQSEASDASSPKKPSVTFKDVLHRIVLYGFYSQFKLDDLLEDNDDDDQTVTDVKTRETHGATYSTGIKIGYELSKHWSLLTGCYYHVSEISIQPTVIYAQTDQNGNVGYNIVTSSGVVNIPNSQIQSQAGDSIKIKANSYRNYLSIPLQVKYDFAFNHKLDFYVTAGVAAKIAVYTATTVHYETTSFREGDLSVNSVQYLDNLNYGYIFGAGFTYPITRRFLVYLEPSIQGSFTSINKDAPVSTYPLNFGLALGLSYHL